MVPNLVSHDLSVRLITHRNTRIDIKSETTEKTEKTEEFYS